MTDEFRKVVEHWRATPLNPYMARLRQETAERRAKRDAAATAALLDPRARLRARITEWWSALPPEARAPRYSLEQLVPLFRCTPQQLGVALFELGWRRKRVWLNEGPYRRYWFPADQRAAPA